MLPDISYVLKISIDELLDNDPYKESAQLEYQQNLDNRLDSSNRICSIKNAVCCGFPVLLLSILVSVIYSVTAFFQYQSEYWIVAFSDSLAETMPPAILLCFVVMLSAYFISRKRQTKKLS